MRRHFLAGLVLSAMASMAFAVEVPIPNGSFEQNPKPSGGYGQTITQWLVSGATPGTSTPPDPGAGTIPNAPNGARPISGIFGSYASYTPTTGSSFAMINNMATGTVSLQSATPFLVNDRRLQFQYVYMTEHSSAQDTFRVQIEFFSDIGLTTPVGGSPITVNATPTETLTGGVASSAPFTPTVYTRPSSAGGGTSWNLLSIDISAFLGSYGRVTFFVDDVGAAPTGNLGITGVLLDDVVLTPEPSTLALFALGLVGMGGLVRRRRRLAAADTTSA